MNRHESRMRRQGGNAMALVLLLVLLLAAGGYNYHRNWALEKEGESKRPFKGYALDDLTSLRNAYEAEVAEYERRYSNQDQKRYRASGDGLMAERVAEFERIKQNSESLRSLGGEVATREAQLAEIDREISIRLALSEGIKVHLRRLTTI